MRKISQKLFGRSEDNQKPVAQNLNTKPLNLSPLTSKVFGLPSNITTNMALDRHQALLAFATQHNIIKIVSLNSRPVVSFTEFEIYQAHDHSIRLLAFVANEGILVSIDEHNLIKNWSMKDLKEPPQECQIPNEKAASACSVYSPGYLTNEPENHGYVFFGLTNGNVYIYNAIENQIEPVVIKYKMLFPEKGGKDTISDMKLNPQMMHRILIAYEETAVVLYSINKDKELQKVMFSQFDSDKGRALAVEFVPPDCLTFVIGFSSGILGFYKCEQKSPKPFKIVDIELA